MLHGSETTSCACYQWSPVHGFRPEPPLTHTQLRHFHNTTQHNTTQHPSSLQESYFGWWEVVQCLVMVWSERCGFGLCLTIASFEFWVMDLIHYHRVMACSVDLKCFFFLCIYERISVLRQLLARVNSHVSLPLQNGLSRNDSSQPFPKIASLGRHCFWVSVLFTVSTF